jgi:hypothetical protein
MAGFTVDTGGLRDVALALAREEDGLRLRRDLASELEKAVEPGAEAAKAGILSLGSAGLSKGESIRKAIADQVDVKARLGGRSAGVRVRALKKGMPRGFDNAPMRFNRQSWRHPVPPPRLPEGAEGPPEPPEWVTQVGKPGWFDDPLRDRRDEYRDAVQKVVADMAGRIGGAAR